MQPINQFGQPVGVLMENWQPCQRPVPQKLQGRYCILESLDIHKHAKALFDLFVKDDEDQSWTYLPYGPFKTVDEFKYWITEKMLDRDNLLYAILNAKTQEPIGICGYLRMNPEHGVIEIGYLSFSKILKRTALATEAIYLLIRQVFDDLGYRRCEWKCNALNKASWQAAERFGFTFEGVFRQNFVFKNRNRDTAWFSILDSEWEGLNNRFQKWLHPDNFDVTGQQILKFSEIK